jgi:hypothetical protein
MKVTQLAATGVLHIKGTSASTSRFMVSLLYGVGSVFTPKLVVIDLVAAQATSATDASIRTSIPSLPLAFDLANMNAH